MSLFLTLAVLESGSSTLSIVRISEITSTRTFRTGFALYKRAVTLRNVWFVVGWADFITEAGKDAEVVMALILSRVLQR